MKCKNCGNELEEHQPYCQKCGYVCRRSYGNALGFFLSLLLFLAGTAALALVWYL